MILVFQFDFTLFGQQSQQALDQILYEPSVPRQHEHGAEGTTVGLRYSMSVRSGIGRTRMAGEGGLRSEGRKGGRGKAEGQ